MHSCLLLAKHPKSLNKSTKSRKPPNSKSSQSTSVAPTALPHIPPTPVRATSAKQVLPASVAKGSEPTSRSLPTDRLQSISPSRAVTRLSSSPACSHSPNPSTTLSQYQLAPVSPPSQRTTAPSHLYNRGRSVVSTALAVIRRFISHPIGNAELEDVKGVAKLVIGDTLPHSDYGRTEFEVERKVKHGRIEKVTVRRSIRIQRKTKPVYLIKY